MTATREFGFLLAVGLILMALAGFAQSYEVQVVGGSQTTTHTITTGQQGPSATPTTSAVATISPDDANVAIHVNYLGPLPVPSYVDQGGAAPVENSNSNTASTTTGFFTLSANGGFDEFYLLLALLLCIAGFMFFAAKSNYESFTRILKRYLSPGGDGSDNASGAPLAPAAEVRPELG